MTCNPCQFCANLYDDSDPSVGLYGYGCRAADDGRDVFDEVKPCPCFRPIPVSEGLMEQLAYEEEERFWKEQEKFWREQE